MITALLELLTESDLIKFLAIVGSIFFFIGVLGRVWGIKEPISKWSRITLLFTGIIMLLSAGVGFSEQKSQLVSSHFFKEVSKETESTQEKAKPVEDNSNKQRIKGSNNKTVGNIKGNNNKVVQGNNNNVDSNNPTIIETSYREGDKIIHLTINKDSGDTLSRRIETIKPKTEQPKKISSPQVEIKCPLNNKTYRAVDHSRYYIKFYDQEGNKFKFISYFNAEDMNGTARINGTVITLNGNHGSGQLSLSNGCGYLTGHLKGKYQSHSMNLQLK